MISTHQLVVSAVMALSALEKLAATIPIVRKITTETPNWPVAAYIGRRSSVASGRTTP